MGGDRPQTALSVSYCCVTDSPNSAAQNSELAALLTRAQVSEEALPVSARSLVSVGSYGLGRGL